MKRKGFIYDKICDIDNIKVAILMASLGKRDKEYVKRALENIDTCSFNIREMLKTKTYVPSPYFIKTIIDGSSGKERTIFKPKFYPDQIIHWALMLNLQPIIMKGMYPYSCGSVPRRGTGLAQKTLRKWLDKDYKGTKYCLKLDIKKFYPSINNGVLKQMFQDTIKDKDCLWLINQIIESNNGLPIGNYTSQWFANFFLQGLDHYIKERLGIKYYIRYVDDLVILGGNKRKLHKARTDIRDYLTSIKLEIKDNWQLFRIDSRPIDFLGFKFYRDKTILRKKNALRIRRRIGKIHKKKNLNYKDACAIVSYWGWIKNSNSFNFYNKYVKPKINLKQARMVISNYAKANSVRRSA